ncbi:hypothetical protein DL767_011215 [Monosporascus sp. MG133]|nr:hypothetical protein DL767_011215 [Monosporascus sp. MG133]
MPKPKRRRFEQFKAWPPPKQSQAASPASAQSGQPRLTSTQNSTQDDHVPQDGSEVCHGQAEKQNTEIPSDINLFTPDMASLFQPNTGTQDWLDYPMDSFETWPLTGQLDLPHHYQSSIVNRPGIEDSDDSDSVVNSNSHSQSQATSNLTPLIMTAILAEALLHSARTARDLLTPLAAPAPTTAPPVVPAVPLTQELQARIQAARDETLEYHRLVTAQVFPPGGEFLPGDWVDEGKLLLFIKEEVAPRAPRKGIRLVEEKKRKKEAAAAAAATTTTTTTTKRPSKRRKGVAGAAGVAAETNSHLIVEGEDDIEQSELVLMYNTVRGYVSAIKELWAYQTSQGLHNAPQPKRVALKALETSIIRGEHARRREEFTDRGISAETAGTLSTRWEAPVF